MSMPSVTFLMAARNAERTIRSAIDSAVHQDYDGEVRVIVVDDASTDGTLSQIPSRDGVEVIQNVRRLGRSGSRNKGLGAITTDFVAIHDADDISLPNRLDSTVPLALDARTVVGSQLIWQDPRTGIYGGPQWPSTFDDTEFALRNFRTPIAHPSMVIPVKLLRGVGGYDESFPVAEDLDLMIRLHRKYPEIRFVNSADQTVVYMRTRLDSLSYSLQSSYWRSKVEAIHIGRRSPRASWLLDASERYVRQRVRCVRGSAFDILRGLAKHDA